MVSLTISSRSNPRLTGLSWVYFVAKFSLVYIHVNVDDTFLVFHPKCDMERNNFSFLVLLRQNSEISN